MPRELATLGWRRQVSGSPAQAYRVVSLWAVSRIQDAVKHGTLDPFGACVATELVMKLRGEIAYIQDIIDVPLPYTYLHILYVCQFLFTLMMAYTLGLTDSEPGHHVFFGSIGWLGLVLMITQLNGALAIAQGLEFPFGAHIDHFPVVEFVQNLATLTRELIDVHVDHSDPTILTQPLEISVGSVGDSVRSFYADSCCSSEGSKVSKEGP